MMAHIAPVTKLDGSQKSWAQAFWLLIVLLASTCWAEADQEVKFRYEDPAAQKVFLAGTFNDWDSSNLEMARNGAVFTRSIRLKPGSYEYKFVVNGTDWKPDPANSVSADDTKGGFNSVKVVRDRSADKQTSAGATALKQSLAIVRIDAGKSRVTFRYSNPAAQTVCVAGSFNGWDPARDAMTKTGGIWEKTVDVPNEVHAYKFCVDGSEWLQDPLNPESVDDERGGNNSVLRLGAAASIRKSEALVSDSLITTAALLHDSTSIDYLNRLPDGGVVIKLRALAHDISTATLEVRSVDGKVQSLAMSPEYADDRFEFFRAVVPTAAGTSTSTVALQYTFKVVDGSTTVLFGDSGVGESGKAPTPFKASPSVLFDTPDWARRIVWYEILPERFRNGDKSNDVTTNSRAWTSDWATPEKGSDQYAIFGRRYGGDLQGCIQMLPYLKELGVGAVWFNPVFQSESIHKYDTEDYRHIDENFGYAGDYAKIVAGEDLLDAKTWKFSETDKLFLEFVRQAHKAGIRVIVDGVFNHSGPAHPAFKDVVKNKQNSRFKDWYNIISWEPFKYEGWGGFGGLPVYKEGPHGFVDPALSEHLFAITRRWMDPNGDGDPSDGIDGWRLDVPNEVNSEFWQKWRKVVKGVNPNAIIVGEIWDPAAKWLKGDQFDCVMNYQFAKALFRFFGNHAKPAVLAENLAKLRTSYPDQSNQVMMNVTNTHDTDRLASMLFNPNRDYDNTNRMQDLRPGGYVYRDCKPTTDTYYRVKQLVAVQFAWIGAPLIYYGDEAGMWGADDPQNRKPMLWADLEPYENPADNHVMRDMLEWYQRCAAIRNTYKQLQTGDYEQLLANDSAGVFAFRRFDDSGSVVVVANNSATSTTAEIPVNGSGYVDALTSPDAEVVVAHALKSDQVTSLRVKPGAASALRPEGGLLKVGLAPFETMILVENRH